MSDEVIEELWRIRREYYQEVGGTLEGLCADKLFERLKTAQKSENPPVVNRTGVRKPLTDKVAETAKPYPEK